MNNKRIAVALPLLVVLGGCEFRVQTAPKERNTTALLLPDDLAYVWRDPDTGCEYLSGSIHSAMTPRLDRRGNQVCVSQ